MSGDRQPFSIPRLLPLVLVAAVIYLLATSTGRPPERTGNYGYDADPAGAREFAAQAGTFAEVGADALEKTRHKDVFLWVYCDRAHRQVYGRPWTAWDQGDAGTCVSFAFALASYTAQCVDYVEGRTSQAPPVTATEPIYGGARTAGVGRNVAPGGDGATGFGAARWLSGQCPGRPDIGGVLYRQAYGQYDLSKYSIPLSREWGRVGVPADIARTAYKTRASAVANVTTWDELVASIERGSPVVLCSNVGYGRYDGRMPERDADGFMKRGKPWGHALCVLATRHPENGGGRSGALIVNSWSPSWCTGPKWPADQPDGSFWASPEDVSAALAQGDCWAVGGVDQFKWRPLDHGMWLEGER